MASRRRRWVAFSVGGVLLLGLGLLLSVPWLLRADVRTYRAFDALNLRWHYQALTRYKLRFKTLPSGPAHQIILAPWVRGVVARTPQNRDRYFSVSIDRDPYRDGLLRRPLAAIWASIGGLIAGDTHFTTPPIWADTREGATPLLASPVYSDGSFLVLYTDGAVVTINQPEKHE